MTESILYMTCENREQAQAIGEALVSKRLVACVNILGGMQSMYWWEGKVVTSSETVCIAKTRTELVDAVTQAVKGMHSYDVPCVVVLPIEGGNPDFLDWIRRETRGD